MTQTTELTQQQEAAPQHGGALVKIVDTPANIEKSWEDFQELKRKIIKPEDMQAYTVGSGANKQTKYFIKKSGWKKIGAAFGVDVQVQNCETITFDHGFFAIKYTVRAIAPSGRYADGVGSCDSHEERFEETTWQKNAEGKSFKQGTGVFRYKYNDIDGTAYTRAANRAISDLVGGGEVSAEEMTGIKDVVPAVPELDAGYQKRLAQLASSKGKAGQDELARLVLGEIGTKFLTVEQATKIGNTLKSFEATVSNTQNKPADQVVETQAREIQEDLDPFIPCPKCDGPMDVSGKFCTAKGCGYKKPA